MVGNVVSYICDHRKIAKQIINFDADVQLDSSASEYVQ